MKRDLIRSRKNEIPTEDEDTSIFMYVLTSIYMFLFVIVLAIVMSINSMADNWEKDITGSITIQVTPIQDENKRINQDKTLEQQNKILQYVEKISGVENVKVLNEDAVKKLMTPWLGNKVDLTTLPIPQLLDVQLKPDADINYDEMTRGLRQISPNATIDNHRLWLNKLLKFANSLKLSALSILFMVIVICALSIYYSARASLNINFASIEILHIVGAKDEYIAKQYSRTYAKIGFFAGIIGLMAAIPCILVVGKYGISTGSGLLNGAHLNTLTWILMLITPLFSAFYARITSYYTVRKSLEKIV